MSKRKTPGTPLPDGFEKLFPDRDSLEQFEEDWALIQKRRGVSPAEVLSILKWGWAYAQWERTTHQSLKVFAPDFIRRTRRIEKLLADLREEMKELQVKEWLEAAILLSRTRCIQADLAGEEPVPTGSRVPSSTELMSPPGALRTRLEEAQRTRVQLAALLANFLKPIEKALRRPRGHQDEPWLARTTQDLRKAGLTKEEADMLLRGIGLKGFEPTETDR